MLQMVIDWATSRGGLSEIALHVQTNNEDALRFYRRFGFEITTTIDKYYQRIEPTSAHLLSRPFKA
jgi:ribosomal protein S18 acetylase RimI-like enzyme